MQPISHFRHTNRNPDSVISKTMKVVSASDTGSGTAVMSKLQPSSVVWPPGLVSAKKSVQVLFGSCPLNGELTSTVKVTGVLKEPDILGVKSTKDDPGKFPSRREAVVKSVIRPPASVKFKVTVEMLVGKTLNVCD